MDAVEVGLLTHSVATSDGGAVEHGCNEGK
jgi:hypothetical protein